MIRILLTLIIYLVCLITASAQHTDQSLIVPEKRDEWIRTTIRELKKIKPDSEFPEAKLQTTELEDFFRISVRIIEKGWIDLPANNRLYIITSSSHNNPEIGDISLAIDNRQRIYMNNGHVCGGIIHFETFQIREVKNSRDFFRHFVSDTDNEAWEKVSRKNFTP